MIKPFLKWVGGKRQLIKEIRARLPENYSEMLHVEPFIGGGSVLFSLQPDRAYVCDYNKDLIATYQEICSRPERVIEELMSMKNTSEDFYQKRREYNRWLEYRGVMFTSFPYLAAMFIYLNKTGFNGMYRINKKGLYNVPWNKNPHEDMSWFINEDDIMDTSEYLSKHVTIGMPSSYSNIFDRVNEPTSSVRYPQFWYLDPPYAPLDKDLERGNFDQYTTFPGWAYDEQIKLRDFCVKLDQNGYFFMLSNSSCSLIHELYKMFKIEEVDARRSISAKASTRGGCKEVIVTNY